MSRLNQEPYIAPVDLSKEHDEFYAALTDSGHCNVYNGNSLLGTFKAGDNDATIKEFASSYDGRKHKFKPLKITGTGKITQVSFWLNVADR